MVTDRPRSHKPARRNTVPVLALTAQASLHKLDVGLQAKPEVCTDQQPGGTA